MKIGKSAISFAALFVVGIALNLSFVNCGGKFNADSAGIYEGASTSAFNSPNPNDPGTGNTSSGGTNGGTSAGTTAGTTSGTTGGTTSGGTTSGSTGNNLVRNFAGVIDPNCLNSDQYDTCVIFKNPVASRKQAYPSVLMRGQNIDDVVTLGVTLEDRSNLGALTSASIRVSATSGTPPRFDSAGKLKVRYNEDRQGSWLAQLMAYFWLTTQEKQMIARTGDFYAGRKNIPVDAFSYNTTDTSLLGNAYFSSSENKIVLGYVPSVPRTTSLAHEMALSAEVYLHEMGHANFHYAVKSVSSTVSLSNDTNAYLYILYQNGVTAIHTLAEARTYCQSTAGACPGQAKASYCITKNGCVGGINEGVADFHHLMLFPDSTPLGETIANTMLGGLNSVQATRDVAQTTTWTTNDFFTKAYSTFTIGGSQRTVSGEIHGMGSAYAAILWGIYNHPNVNRAHFEKIFSNHLKLLTGDSTFVQARAALTATAAAMKSQFGGVDYSPYITSVFTSKGVP